MLDSRFALILFWFFTFSHKRKNEAMLKILRCRLVFLVVLLVLCTMPSSFGMEGSSRWLVSPELLEHANLKVVWDNELPIKKGESLERLVILGERIYALSNRNYIFSLDRQDGKMIFGNSIAPAGLPINGLELYGDKLISIVGNRLIEIDPESGAEHSGFYPGFAIACPPARNSSYFYFVGTDRRVHTFREGDKVQVFEVAADNNSMITSIIADENFVIFSTDAGNLISFTPDRPIKLWQFDAAGGIVGPVVRDGNSLFFACKDTYVYRVDMVHERSAELVWKHQTNALLDKAPYITQEVIYQRAGDKGLAAIDKKSSELLWQLAEGADLLAEAKAKAYVITKVNTLAVMDNNKGKRQYCVNFAQVSRYAVNTMDSKIYIADKSGRIACIEPAEQ